jgi:heptosyltransferase-2
MPKFRDIRQFERIAVLQTAFLGDVALALHLIETIKMLNGSSKRYFITTPAAAPIAECAQSVDEVIAYDKRNKHKGLSGIKLIAGELKDRGVDLILTPHRSLRSTLTSFLSGAFSVGFEKNAFSLFYKKRVPYRKHLHEIERNLLLLRPFGVNYRDFSNVRASVSISDHHLEDLKRIIELKDISQQKTVALAPGSVWETKKWTTAGFIELGKLLIEEGCNVIILGGPADEEVCREVAAKIDCMNLCGRTSIPQTLAILEKCNLLVTNDSAPTHFAGLMKCPTITIFGPTVPEFGFAPRGEFDQVVQDENLKCRPCAIHGTRTCPIKTHECMKNISGEMVFERALSILNRAE